MFFIGRVVAALMVAATLIVSVPSHATEDVQTVLNGARQNWADIRSVVFHTTYSYDHEDFAKAAAQQLNVLKTARREFYIEKNHFRTNQRNFNMSAKQTFAQDLAKDDSKYQEYSPDAMALTVSTSPFNEKLPYGAVFPLFDPLDFARPIGSPHFTLEAVQSEEFWNRLKENAKIIGRDSVNEKPTTVLEFAMPEMIYSGNPYKAIVHFSDSEDFYPVRFTLLVDPDGWVLGDYAVEETQLVPTADGKTMRVPVRTRAIERGERDAAPMTIEVQTDLETLQINADIDDAHFTIPLSQVREYYDANDPSQNWDVVVQERSRLANLSDSIEAAQKTEAASAEAPPGNITDDTRAMGEDNPAEPSGSASVRVGLIAAIVAAVLLLGGALILFSLRKRPLN